MSHIRQDIHLNLSSLMEDGRCHPPPPPPPPPIKTPAEIVGTLFT